MRDSEITFVIQGNPYCRNGVNYTKKLVTALRKYYPGASIVLSVNQENCPDLGQDCSVTNVDVGAIVVEGLKPLNVNRQIVSTLNGFKAARTPWACKIRSDLLLTKRIDFQYYYRNYPERGANASFRERIIVTDITTKNFRVNPAYINHVCDWFYFGRTSDLLKLFDIELYDIHKIPIRNGSYSMSAETYIWTAYLAKSKPVSAIEAEKYLIDNAIVISGSEVGLYPTKTGYRLPFGVNGFLQTNVVDWQLMYNQYLDENYRVKSLDVIKSNFLKAYYKLRWYAFRPAFLARSILKKYVL